MQTTGEKTAKHRPFHEVIVGAIRWAKDLGEMKFLGDLIKATKIPKEHDKIIAAWNQRVRELGFNIDPSVPADLLEQKQEAEEKEKEKTKESAKTTASS